MNKCWKYQCYSNLYTIFSNTRILCTYIFKRKFFKVLVQLGAWQEYEGVHVDSMCSWLCHKIAGSGKGAGKRKGWRLKSQRMFRAKKTHEWSTQRIIGIRKIRRCWFLPASQSGHLHSWTEYQSRIVDIADHHQWRETILSIPLFVV